MSSSAQTISAPETRRFSCLQPEGSVRAAVADAGFQCVLCQSASAAEVGPNPDFPGSRIFGCRRCGLIATSPLPSDAQLEDLYRRQYRQTRNERPDRSYLRHLDARAEAQLRFVRGDGALDPRNARVLDVGCSAGSLLKACSRLTGSLVGFEPDDVMRETARGRLPKTARLHETLFRPSRLRGRTFDLIAASHVLEHVPQPVSFVASLCGLLSDGGVLMIEVPNEDLLTIGNTLAAGGRGLMHLFFFSPESLRSTIEAAGGRIMRLATFGAPKPAQAGITGRARTFTTRWKKLLEGSSDPFAMEGLYRLKNLPKARTRRRLMADSMESICESWFGLPTSVFATNTLRQAPRDKRPRTSALRRNEPLRHT